MANPGEGAASMRCAWLATWRQGTPVYGPRPTYQEGYDLGSARRGCDIQDSDSSVRDADCGVRTGIVREKGSAFILEIVLKSIFRIGPRDRGGNIPFLEKSGANRLFCLTLGLEALAARETRDRLLREEGHDRRE